MTLETQDINIEVVSNLRFVSRFKGIAALVLLVAGLGVAAITVSNRNKSFKTSSQAAVPETCNSYAFATKWGSTGTGNGQFNRVADVTVDSSDYIYVADPINYSVQVFDSSGSFVRRFNTLQDSDGFFVPMVGSIDVDTNGNVWAVSRRHEVHKYSPTGAFLLKVGTGLQGTADGQFRFPQDVAADSANNVYVADSINYRIQKFSSDGTFITKWGSHGSGNGQWDDSIASVTWSEATGNVYVFGYSGGPSIQKFSSDGTFISKWMYPINTASFDIATDSFDHVYMTTVNGSIRKLDANGNTVAEWSGYGAADGFFTSPAGIAIDSQGNVYVSDSTLNSVQKFNCLAGIATPTPTPSPGPVSCVNLKAYRADGSEYNGVDPVATGEILTYRGWADAPGIITFDPQPCTAIGYSCPIALPVQLETGGPLYFAEFRWAISNAGPHSITASYTPNLVVVTPTPTPTQPIATPTPTPTLIPTLTPTPTPTNSPSSTPIPTPTPSPTPNPFACTQYQLVQTFGGTATGSGVGQFNDVEGISVDTANDNVYVADATNRRIQKYNPATNTWSVVLSGVQGTSTTPIYPVGVAVQNQEGTVGLYVTDTAAAKVQVFDKTAGGFLSEFATSTGTQGIAFAPTAIPFIYTSDWWQGSPTGNRVLRYLATSNSFNMSWPATNTGNSNPGSGQGQFNQPGALVSDSSGNIYVVDVMNARIQKFTHATSTWSTFINGAVAGNSNLAWPAGIAIDPLNNVYVTVSQSKEVKKFNSLGQYVTSWTVPPNGTYALPFGVAVDSTGKAYVGMASGYNVFKYACAN